MSMKKIKSVKHLRKTLYEKLLKEKIQPSFFEIRDSLLMMIHYIRYLKFSFNFLNVVFIN